MFITNSYYMLVQRFIAVKICVYSFGKLPILWLHSCTMWECKINIATKSVCLIWSGILLSSYFRTHEVDDVKFGIPILCGLKIHLLSHIIQSAVTEDNTEVMSAKSVVYGFIRSLISFYKYQLLGCVSVNIFQ